MLGKVLHCCTSNGSVQHCNDGHQCHDRRDVSEIIMHAKWPRMYRMLVPLLWLHHWPPIGTLPLLSRFHEQASSSQGTGSSIWSGEHDEHEPLYAIKSINYDWLRLIILVHSKHSTNVFPSPACLKFS